MPSLRPTRELITAVALATVVVAPGRYGPAREPDDVCCVVSVAVPGTLFEDVAVAVPVPATAALHGYALIPDPAVEVELCPRSNPPAAVASRRRLRLFRH